MQITALKSTVKTLPWNLECNTVYKTLFRHQTQIKVREKALGETRAVVQGPKYYDERCGTHWNYKFCLHFSDGEMPEKSLPQRHQSKNFGMGNDAQKGTLIFFYTLTICPYNIILRYNHLDQPTVNPQWIVTCFITTLGTDPSWRKGIWVSYLENDFCSAAHLLKPQTDQTNQIFNLNKKTNKSLGILARAAGRLTSDLRHSLLSSNPASHLIPGCSRPLVEAPPSPVYHTAPPLPTLIPSLMTLSQSQTLAGTPREPVGNSSQGSQ